jgi:hypothetical protein
MYKISDRRGARGFTSLEMVLVSMLVLSFIVVVVRQAAMVSEDSKSAAVVSSVRAISGVVQGRLAGSDTFVGVSNAVVNGLLPQGAVAFDGVSFLSAFGAPIEVRPAVLDGVVDFGYEIEVFGLSTRACGVIALALGSEFEEIYVDGRPVKSGGLEVKPVLDSVIGLCEEKNFQHAVRFVGAG